MVLTAKKYGVSVSFCSKLAFFGKTEGKHLLILCRDLKNFKTPKNLYTRPLCITNPEYGPHNQEIRSFGQFPPQTGFFR